MNFAYQLIDLTHTLDENSPSWNGGCGFHPDMKLDYEDCPDEVKFRVQQIKMHAGIGTHVDAPKHCIREGRTIEQLSINELVSPVILIDVSAQAHERYSVSVEDIAIFEKKYGIIAKGTFVLIKTGWERFWQDPEKYRNQHLFPALSKEAALILLERGASGIGIDTLSPDRPEDGFPVHQTFLGANKYIVENAANLDALPAYGAFIMVLPIKIKNMTEAPIRLVGLVPKKS